MSSLLSRDKLMMQRLDIHLENLIAQGGWSVAGDDMEDDIFVGLVGIANGCLACLCEFDFY